MAKPVEPLSRLVESHRDFLAFVERRVGSRAVAEDILQEAFVKGLDRLGELRDGESVAAWFYRVLRNAVIDHHRRQAAAGRGLEALAAEMASHEAPSAEVQNAVCRCIGQLAETLKPEYAQALKRIELEGVAVKDYASEVGISASNAAVRIFRARQALSKQVTTACGTCAEHGCLDCSCGSSGHHAP